ncbi:AF4/FMR2 family member 4 [Biomphalaria glabrata]|nr:AF4/FMR2 family member 4 [Biomphalaria glabrata]
MSTLLKRSGPCICLVHSATGVEVSGLLFGVQSDESSSSSSSSSSDSDSDEDDNEEKDEHIDKPLEFRKSDRRSSSSSSNSSSDSSSESESEADEDEDEAKAEASEEVKMAPEKTPSPVYKTSSIGTPNSVDNQDTSISWSLGNFIQSGKKNSTSPVAASPSKPFSPPPIHASLAPGHPKEHSDLTHPRTLKAIGPCKSMPFDVQFSSKHSGDEAYDHQSDDETGEVFKSKPSHQPSVRKHSSSSVKDLKARTDQVEDNRNHWAKNSRTMESPPNKKPGVTSVLRSNDPVKKSEASSISSLERNTSSKKHPSRAGSSSDDEIDVVGYTPEKPKHQSNNVQQKGKSEMPLNFPVGALSTSSDEDNHKLLATDKNAPNHIPKHTKRKVNAKGDSSNLKDISKDTPNPGGSKDSILPSDLESMIHPPNLLSPIHTAHSPSPAPSTKPLPSFRNSFSPPPPKARSPIVTVSQSGDGSPAPRLVVRVQKALVNDKQLKRLKEKQEKIRNGGKISKEIKSVEPSAKSEVVSDSQKEARVPPFSDNKSFISVHSTSSIKDKNPSSLTQSDKVANGTVSKTKRKAAVSETDDIGDGTADHNHKIKKPHRKTINPLLEPTSTSSTSSVGSDISTTNVADSKFNKSFNTSVDSLPNKPSAVKNLDFAQKDETDSPLDESKSEPLKSSKRKIENGDESLSKKVRPELVSETAPSTEKNTSNTPSQPTSVRSRRDSNASSSSRGSQQSLKKPSRRSSTSSNKNSNNNNNIDKKSNAHITNGPDLPFHHYVNGNSRGLPSNLPVPEDIQLQKTEHYLARAKEHKHMADNKKDKLARFEPYLRSGLNFFLAGYTIEQGKKDLNASYSLYNDTSNLLQYVIRMRANSSSNPDSSDRERKLIVLIIRLRAFLNHRLYTLRKPEVSKLKKVIDSEQSKLQHSSNPAASAAASSTSTTSSSNTNSSNKAHAPSPHQSSWNKNSTGTPSPMSPTPSPATSVSSQGSCELVQGKIANGTSQISPSPGMVSVQQRVHTVTQKYFTLTSHIVKALELWDQADAETKGLEDFFATVDAACGVLTFHSDPPTIVRYIKHALRLLYL